MRKKIILFIAFFCFLKAITQNKIPVIKSNTDKVKIIEDGLAVTNWNLDPSAKPDVYKSEKVSKFKKLKLVTDIDSIEVKLKDNQTFDFVVIKGKDSCFTRFATPKKIIFEEQISAKPDTIKFDFNKENNMVLKVLFNKKDTLDFTFDTGAYSFSMTRAMIKKYFNPDGKKTKITMKEIGDNNFKIGKLEFIHQQVYPIDEVPKGSVGLVGWKIFDGKILEIDYDNKLLIIHQKLPKLSRDYQKLQMKYIREHFFIEAFIEAKNKKYKNLFLFDTGYQKTALVNNKSLEELNFPIDNLTALSKSVLKNSRNENVEVTTLESKKMGFGRFIINKVPIQISRKNNLLTYNANYLGVEILMRFNTILDFQDDKIYMKPNQFYNFFLKSLTRN